MNPDKKNAASDALRIAYPLPNLSRGFLCGRKIFSKQGVQNAMVKNKTERKDCSVVQMAWNLVGVQRKTQTAENTLCNASPFRT